MSQQPRVLSIAGLVLVLTLGALSGCRGGEQRDASSTRRDSAGIAIVESSRAAWDSTDAWTVDTTPKLSIGVVEGDSAYMLNRVAGATRLPDGRVVIGDGGSSQLRFFDSTGAFIEAVGRKGQGPGEFQYLRGLERCGADSVFAFDLNWQMKVFTSAGKLGRELEVREPGSTTPPYRLACSPAGVLVISLWGERTRAPTIGFYRSMSKVLVLDAEGRETANLGEHLASERIVTQTGSGPHPFGRQTSSAAGENMVYLGDGERFEIRRYSRDGKLERIQRAPPEDLTIGPSVLEPYRAAELAAATERNRATIERRLAEMPMPEGLPAFTRLRVDVDGNLWAQRVRPSGGVRERWGVFSEDGSFLGHVELPNRFALLEIGDDYVLGVTKDDEAVEVVRVHPLVRSGR